MNWYKKTFILVTVVCATLFVGCINSSGNSNENSTECDKPRYRITTKYGVIESCYINQSDINKHIYYIEEYKTGDEIVIKDFVKIEKIEQ